VTQTVPLAAQLGAAYSGDTIHYRILNGDGTEYATWTSSGVTEIGTTGTYFVAGLVNALTQVSGATNEYVLTKDTSTGDATWKAAAGGVTDHAALSNLDYASAGHTGFAGTGISNTFTAAQTIGGNNSTVDFTAMQLLDVVSPTRGWQIIVGKFNHASYGNYPLIFKPLSGQRIVLEQTLQIEASTSMVYSAASRMQRIGGNYVFNFGTHTYIGSNGQIYLRQGDAETGTTALRVNASGQVIVSSNDSLTANSRLYVDQNSSTAAIPPLLLNQADDSEEMIEFTAAVGTGVFVSKIFGVHCG